MNCLVCGQPCEVFSVCDACHPRVCQALDREPIAASCQKCGIYPLKRENYLELIPGAESKLPGEDFKFVIVSYKSSGCHQCEPSLAHPVHVQRIRGLSTDPKTPK